MGQFVIFLTSKAKADIAKHKKSGNKSVENKIKTILNELKKTSLHRNGTTRTIKTRIVWFLVEKNKPKRPNYLLC